MLSTLKKAVRILGIKNGVSLILYRKLKKYLKRSKIIELRIKEAKQPFYARTKTTDLEVIWDIFIRGG